MNNNHWRHIWIVVLLIIIMAGYCAWRFRSMYDPPNVQSGIPLKKLTDWKYRWGDSPINDNGIPAWTYQDLHSSDWVDLEKGVTSLGSKENDFLWLQVPIPTGEWADPSILLQVEGDFEIYVDSNKIHQFGDLNPTLRSHGLRGWVIVPLQNNHLGKKLFLRIYSSYKWIGVSNIGGIGARSDHLLKIFLDQFEYLLVALFLTFIGVLSLSMFIYLQDIEYFFFAGFSLLSGVNTFSRVGFISFYLGISNSFAIIAAISSQVAYLCLVCFYETIFYERHVKIIRGLRWLLLVFIFVHACLCTFDLSWGLNIDFIFHQLFGITLIVMLFDVIRMSRKGIEESKLYLIGLIIFLVLEVNGKILYSLVYFEYFSQLLSQSNFWFLWRPTSHFSPLVLSILLIAILIRRLRDYRILEIRNQKLRELDQMKSAFVSQASHDLRTPLTAIKSSLDNVIRGVGGGLNEKQSSVIGRALKSVDRLTHLINDVLDINRIESGREVLNKEEVLFNVLVKNAVMENQPAANQKNITISTTGFDQSCRLLIDPGKIERVVGELIGNAIKYTPERGRVGVTLTNDDKYVSLKVKDSGIGMTEEECNKIWERFYRTDASKTIAKGSGLGLSIAKELVEMHGGSICVESQINLGTTFIVTLPFDERNKP